MRTRTVVGLGIVAVLAALRLRSAATVAAAISDRRAGVEMSRARVGTPTPRPTLAAEPPKQLDPAPWMSISGHLVDDHGRPASGATIIATSSAMSGDGVAIADHNGAYVVPDLPPGVYAITIYYDSRAVTYQGIAVTEAAPSRYDSVLPAPQAWRPFADDYGRTGPSGALVGHLAHRDGAAAAGATVVARSPALQHDQIVVADENGNYVITSLPPGSYELVVYDGDRTFLREPLVVRIGEESRDYFVLGQVDADGVTAAPM